MKKKSEKSTLSRRKFLLSSSIGFAAVGSNSFLNPDLTHEQNPKIKYVTLGRTGLRVSNVGYGVSRGSLDPSTIAYAINKGINYFDSSEGYGRGENERKLGKAIKKYRNKIIVTTKIGSVNAAGRLTRETTKEEILDKSLACLQRLDTPYIDILMVHGAGDPDLGGFDNPNLDAVVNQLKSEGKIKYFGFSTHNYNLIDTVKHAITTNKVDVMMLSYNYFQEEAPKGYNVPKNWLRELNEVIKLAHSKNIGITTMKALQGAQETNAIKKGIDPIEAKKSAAKWSLNNPNIDVAVISLANVQEIDALAEVSGKMMEKNDWETLDILRKESGKTLCRIGCPAPCMDNCPYHVAIPDILRMNMYFADCGWEKQAMLEYAQINAKNDAGRCLTCTEDVCTKNCMFSIPVKEKLITSHENLTLDYT